MTSIKKSGPLTHFKAARSTKDRLRYAADLGQVDSPSRLWLSSQAYLETAVREDPGTERQPEIFAMATNVAKRGLDIASYQNSDASYVKYGLMNTLSSIPLYANMFYLGSMPSIDLLHKYRLSALEQIGHIIMDLSSDGFSSVEKQGLGGLLGELVAKALLNGYGLFMIGDNSFIALPALLTEDRGIANRGGYDDNALRNMWDVSVYTDVDLDGEIDMSYPVQVKSGSSPMVEYSPEIVVIAPGMLALEGESFTGGWQRIGRELRGAETVPAAAEIIDARMDRLVDILNGDI